MNRTHIASYDITETGSGFGSGIGAKFIQPAEKRQVLDEGEIQSTLLSAQSYLVIFDLVLEDEGYYTCMAENGIENHIDSVGNVESFITVQSKEVIFCTQLCIYEIMYTQEPLMSSQVSFHQ